jgi:hypothetical protein
MAGTDICPICHCNKLPHHIPTKCPLLAKLNLKLITCLPVVSSPSPGTPAPASLPSPASAPSPSSCAAAADTSLVSGSLGSSSAPSNLMAAVAQDNPTPGNFDSVEEFHWEDDDHGVDYAPPPKVNMGVASNFPSCSHACVGPSTSTSALSSPLQAKPPRLSSALQHLLNKLSLSPVDVPLLQGQLAVADTGATNHMVPDKS